MYFNQENQETSIKKLKLQQITVKWCQLDGFPCLRGGGGGV